MKTVSVEYGITPERRHNVAREAFRRLVPKPPETILMIRSARAGLAVIRAEEIHEDFPNAQIIILTSKVAAHLLEKTGLFSEIRIAPYQLNETSDVLLAPPRGKKWDCIVVLYNSNHLRGNEYFHIDQLAKCAGAPVMVTNLDGDWGLLEWQDFVIRRFREKYFRPILRTVMKIISLFFALIFFNLSKRKIK